MNAHGLRDPALPELPYFAGLDSAARKQVLT